VTCAGSDQTGVAALRHQARAGRGASRDDPADLGGVGRAHHAPRLPAEATGPVRLVGRPAIGVGQDVVRADDPSKPGEQLVGSRVSYRFAT
jgi:hypothetical protein